MTDFNVSPSISKSCWFGTFESLIVGQNQTYFTIWSCVHWVYILLIWTRSAHVSDLDVTFRWVSARGVICIAKISSVCQNLISADKHIETFYLKACCLQQPSMSICSSIGKQLPWSALEFKNMLSMPLTMGVFSKKGSWCYWIHLSVHNSCGAWLEECRVWRLQVLSKLSSALLKLK